MAIETGLPLVVATLVGVKQVSDCKRKLDLAAGEIKCFGENSIDTSTMSSKDIPRLMEETKSLMLKRLESKCLN